MTRPPPSPEALAARNTAERTRRRSGASRPVVGAELETTRALLLAALAHLEATAGLGGRLQRYVVDGAPHGPWAAHLARAAGVREPAHLRAAWAGRAARKPALALVTEYLRAGLDARPARAT